MNNAELQVTLTQRVFQGHFTYLNDGQSARKDISKLSLLQFPTECRQSLDVISQPTMLSFSALPLHCWLGYVACINCLQYDM